jgi:hypothetical protein
VRCFSLAALKFVLVPLIAERGRWLFEDRVGRRAFGLLMERVTTVCRRLTLRKVTIYSLQFTVYNLQFTVYNFSSSSHIIVVKNQARFDSGAAEGNCMQTALGGT